MSVHAWLRTLLLFILILSGCASLENSDDSFTVAAVQFEINEEIFAGEDIFREKAVKLIEEAVKGNKADMIIFPEYTSVFLSLMKYAPVVTGSDTFAEGFGKIQQMNSRIQSLKDLFLLEQGQIEQRMDELWGELAGQYEVYIVAGSTFVPYQGEDGETVVYNRSFVYGPGGSRVYTQDKVFLTDFEREILNLAPGSLERAAGFSVEGLKTVLTICRDTFMDVWEHKFSGAHLWLDLKANGDAYDQEQAENFRKALPERITNTDVPYGITVCLTGSYLDLFWEGESTVIKKTENGYSVVDSAENWTGEDILYVSLFN